MTQALNIIARIVPHEQHYAAAREAICDIVDATRAEPGCVDFRLCEDADEQVLYLYEEWRDEAALAAHHRQPYTQAVFEAYRSWLAEDLDIRHLRPVR